MDIQEIENGFLISRTQVKMIGGQNIVKEQVFYAKTEEEVGDKIVELLNENNPYE